MLLKVGELAARTGLTVRTLHHYDAIGLLAPSARSDAGYRLYDANDMARLHAIQALRQLGLPLAEIARLLGQGKTLLPDVLQRQIGLLDKQIADARSLRTRLGLLQERLEDDGEPDAADWLGALELMTACSRHFDATEVRRIVEGGKQLGDQWPPLVAAIRALMQRKVRADSPEVQPLAARWLHLMSSWMDGDTELIVRWGRMYMQEDAIARQLEGPSTELIAYIGEAIDLRLRALSRHLTQGELARIGVPPEDAWRKLGVEANRLMARGAPTDGKAMQSVAREWTRLFLEMVDHDEALGARLITALASEPLLQAASVLEDPLLRDYIQRAIALLPKGA